MKKIIAREGIIIVAVFILSALLFLFIAGLKKMNIQIHMLRKHGHGRIKKPTKNI